ncbi:DNA cytosine methyltransferase [Corynebacterium cystitidis]|uniref:DNA cytosine methyltransferase n=1 Tax=Corynebacterium cystitidis TaxID=35757 RepID=UPI00211DC08B|nr:DNA cytosine methyltransferase [Corynebacterium cystitidis]
MIYVKIKTASPTYVSLFSSGGIADFGLHTAGFKCIASAELLSRRLEVQRLNGIADDRSLICGDLMDQWVYDRVIDHTLGSLEKMDTPLTLVLATPPCQGMSVANHKKKNELARNSLVVRSIEMIDKLKPLVFVFENVPAFTRTTCTGNDGENRPIGEEIERVLGGEYEYYSKTLRLQDFGSPSSRRRSITIGVRNDMSWVTPLDLLPTPKPASRLRDLIGDLPRLTTMGETADDDLFHAFRPYAPHMRPWIEATPEDQSAFDNSNEALRPHRVVNGKIVPNVNKNGDKYKRVSWDSIPPCVHTRNDTLASQNTVHPEDDRVFSIRELMRMMGLPENFVWFAGQERACRKKDTELLRKHAPNIRQCLGEGVPAPVMEAIGKQIRKHLLQHLEISRGKPKRNIDSSWSTKAQRAAYMDIHQQKKRRLSAFYTEPLAAFAVLKRAWAPYSESSRVVRVLEPSVGSGVFLTILDQLITRQRVRITAYDIDPALSDVWKELETHLENVESIEFVLSDFISTDVEKFDLVIGNPPFGRQARNKNSKWSIHTEIAINFFSKAAAISDRVAFIFPKAILHAHTYRSLRERLLESFALKSVIDFGETAFPDVLVETIGIHISKKSSEESCQLKSFPKAASRTNPSQYLTDPSFPTWVIYRNAWFDQCLDQVQLDRFTVWRDRQISRRLADSNGVRVIRGKNIGKNRELVSDPKDYKVPNEIAQPVIETIRNLESTSLFLAPNLSYYPRAITFECSTLAVPEGSCAVLIGDLDDTETNLFLEYSSSDEFSRFYRIAFNFATRSLNIDQSTVFWWGIPLKAES